MLGHTGTLWEGDEALKPASLVDVKIDPLDHEALVLYHSAFREAIRGVTKPTFSYSQTHGALRYLAICNPIIGSISPGLQQMKTVVKQIEKVVKSRPPKTQEEAALEVRAVLKILKKCTGISTASLESDKSLLSAVEDLISHIRDGKQNGFASVFQSLASDSVFTVAHSLLYVVHSLGLGIRYVSESGARLVPGCLKTAMQIQHVAAPGPRFPGGIFGAFIRYFIRSFSMIMFPPLLALTGGLAAAMGVACLMGIPVLLSKIASFIAVKAINTSIPVYMHAQLFRLQRDPRGAALLKDAFKSKFADMLTKMWQLDSTPAKSAGSALPPLTTFSSEVFSKGFLTGVVEFSREFSLFMESDYLEGYEDDATKCYEQSVVLAKTKLICENTYRRTESFAARCRGALNFISWVSFRAYIADLMSIMYNTAKITLEALSNQSGHVSIETINESFRREEIANSFSNLVTIKPGLKKDVHNITAGLAGIVSFLELRKLHMWRPRSAESTERVRVAAMQGGQSKKEQAVQELNMPSSDYPSLVNERFEAFASLDVPLELALAVPEPPTAAAVEDYSTTAAEDVLLEKYAAKRDLLMMSLLRRSVSKLISAFNNIFGRLEKMVMVAVAQERVQPCRPEQKHSCYNFDEATKSRFAVLQFLVAAHFGVSVGEEDHTAWSNEDLTQDFMTFFKDAAWFRYRSRRLNIFRRKPSWGLDMLIKHLFPDGGKRADKEQPLSQEELSLIEQAGALWWNSWPGDPFAARQQAQPRHVFGPHGNKHFFSANRKLAPEQFFTLAAAGPDVASAKTRATTHMRTAGSLGQNMRAPQDAAVVYAFCFRIPSESIYFKLERLQCNKEGSVLLLTTDMGKVKAFRPEPPLSQELQKQLCIPEFEFVGLNGWYKTKGKGGQLSVPGVQDIEGFAVDASVILRSRQEDEKVAHLIEAALWSRGIPRIDAVLVADLMVATKRMLYREETWEYFFNTSTPVDWDFVQHTLSSDMRPDSSKFADFEHTGLYSIDLSAEAVLGLISRSLETTVIVAGSLRSGLLDLALIASGSLALEAYRVVERNTSGFTSLFGKFQSILWDEYAERKQRTGERPVFHHQPKERFATASQPLEPIHQDSRKSAFSRALHVEEGTSEPLIESWCEELHNSAVTSPDEPHSAKLDAHDAGVIQCALLRFLGKRQTGVPDQKEKEAVFKYLSHVTQLLRKSKKTNRYSWKVYLNAKPPRKGEERERASALRVAAARAFTVLKKKVTRGIKILMHKIRSESAKRIFGRRVFNILRGPEYLRTLQLAAVEAFADQSLYPSRVLVHPMALVAFGRIRSIIEVAVQPLMDRIEGTEVVVQMKMMPTPSPTMRRLIRQLQAKLGAASVDFGPAYKQHVRQAAGYITLLHATNSASPYVGPHLSSLFSRYAYLVNQSEKSKSKYLIAERRLAFEEQAGLKLAIKAREALTLLEASAKEPLKQLGIHTAPALLSFTVPESSPPSAASLGLLVDCAAAQEMHLPPLGRASILLYCTVVVPVLNIPKHVQMRKVILEVLRELKEMLISSESPVYFQPKVEDTSQSLPFDDIESLLAVVQALKFSDETEALSELKAVFMLHAPLIKSLEIIGLGAETYGEGSIASPLQCTPKDRSSELWYTTPVNTVSRLRMISSLLLQLADAEDVIEQATASTVEDKETKGSQEEASGISALKGHGLHRVTAAVATGIEDKEPTGTLSEHKGIAALDMASKQSPAQRIPMSDGPTDNGDPEATPRSAVEAASEKSQMPRPVPPRVSGSENRKAERELSVKHEVEMSIKAKREALENAKKITDYLEKQISEFDAHTSAFASTFHLLLSIAQLSSLHFTAISDRIVELLEIAILGRPRKKNRRWLLGIKALRRRGNRWHTQTSEARLPVDAMQIPLKKRKVENGGGQSYSTLFLASSVKNILILLRQTWERLLKDDHLAVLSSACKQGADLWLGDDLPAHAVNEQNAAEGELMGSAVWKAQAQSQQIREGRQELCTHPLWLEHQSRVLIEHSMVEAEKLFPYFVRMGLENVKLVQAKGEQALLDYLWDKLIVARLIGPDVSAEAVSSALERAPQAISVLQTKEPLMAVSSVSVLTLDALELLLRSPSTTKDGLREMMQQLQQQAVEKAAAFLLSKTAAVGMDAANAAVRQLVETSGPLVVDGSASDSTASPKSTYSDLRSWLVQAYFTADSLLLLTRPSAFNPTVAFIDLIQHIIKPRSQVSSVWRRALKSTRQLASSSLDLLLRLPRAYVRYSGDNSTTKESL
ncbi:uncharacterized protein LOC34622805 [Cyclospora cayetanensis]|uniref:Uncharacterized protein LOC34622805 n=1 Tax=Cyclospora cayetanensis TaxID=88456 RepID=A0A6P6S460_9EIME|nr:uncharacterized protein LOC34622805 [Cyclospora cayetanensis]